MQLGARGKTLSHPFPLSLAPPQPAGVYTPLGRGLQTRGLVLSGVCSVPVPEEGAQAGGERRGQEGVLRRGRVGCREAGEPGCREERDAEAQSTGRQGGLYCEVGDLAASNIFFRPSIPDMASTFFLQSPTSTGRSFSVSSFFTDFRLARRSIDTLCFEPRRALSMASAETRTRRSGGRLNFPRRSSTFSFRSLICR